MLFQDILRNNHTTEHASMIYLNECICVVEEVSEGLEDAYEGNDEDRHQLHGRSDLPSPAKK